MIFYTYNTCPVLTHHRWTPVIFILFEYNLLSARVRSLVKQIKCWNTTHTFNRTIIFQDDNWEALRRLLPTPIPTRTKVSREARPLMRRSSSHSTIPFSNSKTIVEPPRKSISALLDGNKCDLTKGEISKFLATLDLLTLFHSCLNTSNHHGTYTHSHDTPKYRTIYGNDLANILTIHIECCTDSLRLRLEVR